MYRVLTSLLSSFSSPPSLLPPPSPPPLPFLHVPLPPYPLSPILSLLPLPPLSLSLLFSLPPFPIPFLLSHLLSFLTSLTSQPSLLHSMEDLRQNIQCSTSVPPSEQYLVLRNGHMPLPSDPASMCIQVRFSHVTGQAVS